MSPRLIQVFCLFAFAFIPTLAQTSTNPLYARMDMTLEADGSLTINSARILPGYLPEPVHTMGEYLYELTYRGTPFARGSFQKDLLQRSADPDGTQGHGSLPREDQYFTIRFPVGDWYGSVTLTDLVELTIHQINGNIHDMTQLDPARIAAAHPDDIQLIHQSGMGDLTTALMDAKAVRDRDPNADAHLNWEVDEPILFPNATVTPVLINGPSSEKKNIAIIGEGFTQSEQADFNQHVEDLLIKGVFGEDLYRETINAFNVYRINVNSEESGISKQGQARWISEYYENPDDLVIRGGTITLSFANGDEVSHNSINNTSLSSIASTFDAFEIMTPDNCGVNKLQSVMAWVSYKNMDIDSDGEDEFVGRLNILGPKYYFDHFSVTHNPVNGASPLLQLKTYTPPVNDPKDTALEMVFSGNQPYCWMQAGCNSVAIKNELVNLVPDAHYVQLILNTNSYGGCHHGSGFMSVTTHADASLVLAHEMGHGFNLKDEYNNGKKYTSENERVEPNVSKESDPDLIKWADFLPPGTESPTEHDITRHEVRDAGVFEGCDEYYNLHRPAFKCRMRSSSTTEFCPVCYHHIRTTLTPMQNNNFQNFVIGDFNGDGRDDAVFQQASMMDLYITDNDSLHFSWNAYRELDNQWTLSTNDQYIVGDFDGDGNDDLVLWRAPMWGTAKLAIVTAEQNGNETFFELQTLYSGSVDGKSLSFRDKLLVGDFNGDQMDDLFVYDAKLKTMTLLRSNGSSFTNIAHHKDKINGMILAGDARMQVGDFNNDGLADIFSHSPSWNRMRIWRSTGNDLQYAHNRYNSFPADQGVTAAQIQDGDSYHVADINGDGFSDLYMFNHTEEANGRLVLLRSDGSQLVTMANYSGSLGAWNFSTGDQLVIADNTNDGRDDIIFYNQAQQLPSLGMARSVGNGLITSTRYLSAVDGWSLQGNETVLVGDFNGGGFDDLFLGNPTRFGMFRSMGTSLDLKRHYKDFIHTFNYYAPLLHGL